MLARAPFAELTVGAARLALLKDGAQAFPSMLAAIAAAKETICFESYIFRDDATGRIFTAALKERAQAGVEVNLMFDGWGSSISEDTLLELRLAGIRCLAFQPVNLFGRWGPIIARLKRRNHRKSLIVDGAVGFTGGLNISDDYAAVEDGGHGWRDTHLRIEGPVVADLERLFLETWRRYKGAVLDEPRYQRPKLERGPVRVVGNHFRSDRKDIRRAYISAMQTAQRTIFLTNAYFLPPARMLKALTQAARRKVRVAVILAAATDVGLVLWAARGLYPRLLKAGIEVYEWEGRILHAKTAAVDGKWATVGSANLDALSLRQNLEVNAVVDDAAFASAVERMFEEDLASCVRVTQQSIKDRRLGDRILSWFAYQFRHWL